MYVWLLAIRPKTLVVAMVPVCVGGVLAYEGNGFHLISFCCALVCALLIQIGTNLSNDYFDFVQKTDTHDRVGPLRVTQAGLLRPEQVRKAFIWTFALAVLFGMYLVQRGGYGIALLGMICIASGIGYTASSYSLARTGLADSWVVVFFGAVATAGTYYVQALQFNWQAAYVGTAFGLLALGLLTVNNLRDHKQDAQAGKKTLVVRFGHTFGCIEYTLAMALPVVTILGFAFYTEHLFLLLPIFVLCAGASYCVWCVWKAKQPEDFLPLLPQTAAVLALFGFTFCVAWLV
ncbi:MAG: 1,4-dihydroxy-2-naphthoate octaprenyltransferase [Myxococcota bacterium]